jgi:hypothetical protein
MATASSGLKLPAPEPRLDVMASRTGTDEKGIQALPTDRELRAILASGFAPLLGFDDEVELHTHSGSSFRGRVEDCSLAGVVLRCGDARLVFVPTNSIDHCVITEEVNGDGETVAEDHHETEPAACDEAVSPIPRSA